MSGQSLRTQIPCMEASAREIVAMQIVPQPVETRITADFYLNASPQQWAEALAAMGGEEDVI